MKKIVIGIASLACAMSMFAVDFSARNVMEGSILGGNKDSFYIWKLNAKDQKDGDALVLSANTEKAGANMQFCYNYAGNEADLKVRKTSIWFKPIDQIKVTVGNVSTKLFGETLHHWKDPAGIADVNNNKGYENYSGYGTVEGAGINVDVTPIDGLLITAGIAAGANNNFITFAKDVDPAIKAWGAGAKYNLNGVAGIPLAVGVEFRSAGSKAEKVLGIGASYGGRYAEGFYGMVEARLRMNENDGGKLNGVTINNHFRFAKAAWEAQLRAPVTIRLPEGNDEAKKADPSWLTWSAKFNYAFDSLAAYCLIGSEIDGQRNNYILNDEFAKTFGLDIQPGVTFNVGAVAFDVGLLIDVAPKYTAETNAISYSVPFVASMSF